MFNDMHDIQCSISQLTKKGLVTCGSNVFEPIPHGLVEYTGGTA